MRSGIPLWLHFTSVGICLAVIMFVGVQTGKIERKYKASQLELANAYEAHASLIIEHELTLDGYALCIAIINPPTHPTPAEAAALFNEYIEQH